MLLSELPFPGLMATQASPDAAPKRQTPLVCVSPAGKGPGSGRAQKCFVLPERGQRGAQRSQAGCAPSQSHVLSCALLHQGCGNQDQDQGTVLVMLPCRALHSCWLWLLEQAGTRHRSLVSLVPSPCQDGFAVQFPFASLCQQP